MEHSLKVPEDKLDNGVALCHRAHKHLLPGTGDFGEVVHKPFGNTNEVVTFASAAERLGHGHLCGECLRRSRLGNAAVGDPHRDTAALLALVTVTTVGRLEENSAVTSGNGLAGGDGIPCSEAALLDEAGGEVLDAEVDLGVVCKDE